MNEKLKLIPIHEEDVIEDEMLNFITAGATPTTNCNPNNCVINSGKCSGVNECEKNTADCSGTNKCSINTSTTQPDPSVQPTNP